MHRGGEVGEVGRIGVAEHEPVFRGQDSSCRYGRRAWDGPLGGSEKSLLPQQLFSWTYLDNRMENLTLNDLIFQIKTDFLSII